MAKKRVLGKHIKEIKARVACYPPIVIQNRHEALLKRGISSKETTVEGHIKNMPKEENTVAARGARYPSLGLADPSMPSSEARYALLAVSS